MGTSLASGKGMTRGTVLAIALAAGGCSVARPFEPGRLAPADRQELRLLEITPVAQRHENDCGPAALSEVLGSWGVPAEVPARPEPFTTGELREEARRRGPAAFLFEGSWEDVVEQLGKGRPLVVALKPEWRVGLLRLPQPEIAHTVVVMGVNAAREFLVFDDPEKGRRRLGKKDFLRQWAKMGRVSLLVARTSQQ
jgi:ABC-type bacteriocin/lantibiotic exporter with double-glycine peptidase domain